MQIPAERVPRDIASNYRNTATDVRRRRHRTGVRESRRSHTERSGLLRSVWDCRPPAVRRTANQFFFFSPRRRFWRRFIAVVSPSREFHGPISLNFSSDVFSARAITALRSARDIFIFRKKRDSRDNFFKCFCNFSPHFTNSHYNRCYLLSISNRYILKTKTVLNIDSIICSK